MRIWLFAESPHAGPGMSLTSPAHPPALSCAESSVPPPISHPPDAPSVPTSSWVEMSPQAFLPRGVPINTSGTSYHYAFQLLVGMQAYYWQITLC